MVLCHICIISVALAADAATAGGGVRVECGVDGRADWLLVWCTRAIHSHTGLLRVLFSSLLLPDLLTD